MCWCGLSKKCVSYHFPQIFGAHRNVIVNVRGNFLTFWSHGCSDIMAVKNTNFVENSKQHKKPAIEGFCRKTFTGRQTFSDFWDAHSKTNFQWFLVCSTYLFNARPVIPCINWTILPSLMYSGGESTSNIVLFGCLTIHQLLTSLNA